jgi:PAS domain-containing protein
MGSMRENSSTNVPFRLCGAAPPAAGDGTDATYFAPAGRSSAEELRSQRKVLANDPLFQATVDSLAVNLAILNDNRQIVAANTALLKTLGVGAEAVVGKRPGEALGCGHWQQGPDGCGTAPHCATCGAVKAILETQSTGRQAKYECRLSGESPAGGGAMDLLVTASLIEIDRQQFTICTIENVADQKRLAVLMRSFFHDVLNTAGVIQGYSDYLADGVADGQERDDCVQRINLLARQLVEEIQTHRDLTCAEMSELTPHLERIRPAIVLADLATAYAKHDVGLGRTIVARGLWEGELVTDGQLLRRVLGNMLKNALEASACGDTVTVACLDRGDAVVFTVHNALAMPEEVKLQLFQRSFSTKEEPGRGIGTYSMKLLGERYLGGKVDFTSNPVQGTTFTFALPKTSDPVGAPAA